MGRTFCHVVVALVLGAVITLLVAWSCALWVDVSASSPVSQSRLSQDQTIQSHRVEYRRAGAWRIEQFETTVEDSTAISDTSDSKHAFDSSWARNTEELIAYTKMIDDARGWPLVAMHGGFDINSPDGMGMIGDTFGAFLIDFRPQVPGVDKSNTPFIPLAPVWLGFIVDTLMYGSISFLVMLGFRSIRKKSARRILSS